MWTAFIESDHNRNLDNFKSHYLKATLTRAPVYSRAMWHVRGVVERGQVKVRVRLPWSEREGGRWELQHGSSSSSWVKSVELSAWESHTVCSTQSMQLLGDGMDWDKGTVQVDNAVWWWAFLISSLIALREMGRWLFQFFSVISWKGTVTYLS